MKPTKWYWRPAKNQAGHIIMKTCLYNVDPLKTNFYIVQVQKLLQKAA